MLGRLSEAWSMLSSCGFLSSERFRSFFLYTKEPIEELLFGSMTRKSWYTMLGASPIFMVMMPMLSLILIGLALIDIYELIKAKEKNIDLWLNAIIGSICACLTAVSISLLEITLLTGTTFACGPWFFLASVVVFSGNALFQTGLNSWRAYHSPSGSQQRLEEIQSAINWAFIFTSVLSVIGCVVFVILFPNLCVAAGVACAAAAVALTTISLLWRMTPSGIKSKIKQCVGLEHKEHPEVDEKPINEQDLSSSILNQQLITDTDVDKRLGWCYSSTSTSPVDTLHSSCDVSDLSCGY